MAVREAESADLPERARPCRNLFSAKVAIQAGKKVTLSETKFRTAMKLRYLLPLAGVFCTCLSTYASRRRPVRPSTGAPAASAPGRCSVTKRRWRRWPPTCANISTSKRPATVWSADDAIVLSTDPTLGGEAFRLTVAPAADRNRGRFVRRAYSTGVQALFRLLPAEIYAKNCPLPVEIACTKGRRTRRASRTAA